MAITKRGNSWRISYEAERGPDGKRRTHKITVRGTRKDAEKELRRLQSAQDAGTSVDPSRVTIAQYMDQFLAAHTGTPKTRERYQQLARHQIIPHLGSIPIQKLRPGRIEDWVRSLGKTGISNRTIGHARRLLNTMYQCALRREDVARNPVAAVRAPSVVASEVKIVQDVPALKTQLVGSRLRLIALVALATGLRRGELLALTWQDIDLDKCLVHVRRALEETEAGLRFKEPKSRAGRRTVSTPGNVVEELRQHRIAQREEYLRVMLRPEHDLVFPRPDGSPYSPDALSREWGHLHTGVNFHALRHTHASALIAAGLDIVAISRRLGHSNPAITLRVYAHLVDASRSDDLARDAVARFLG